MVNVFASRIAKEGNAATTVAVEAVGNVLLSSFVQTRPQMEQYVHVEAVHHREATVPSQRILRARVLSRPMFVFKFRGGHVQATWPLDVL